MKILSLFLLFVLVWLNASLVIGESYKEFYSRTIYSSDGDLVLVTNRVYYENEKRYSTLDYRYGYSYRDKKVYFDERYKESSSFEKVDDKSSFRRFNSGEDKKSYYWKYVPHLRQYEKIECYNSPPRGKIIYTRCP